METSSDRIKLKDKIVTNISKSIKSIQELLYYQSKDQVLTGAVISLTLSNGDWQCHKLCENLDHALLHGLKQVSHGYWRVVKELSHKQMVKEIDMLTNITTDLGKGRAWLYASLNEGLLESYIRLLCDSDKLLKKYYAKEALMLDEDRMNILLTHTSGLEFVRFQLDYDVPYLDVSACPPRILTYSDPEDSTGPPSLHMYQDQNVCVNPVESKGQQQSDSDSASIASLDGQGQSETVSHMKISMISSDSGCPTDGIYSDSSKQHGATLAEAVSNRQDFLSSADSISVSSVGSSGDPDRHKRLENIVVYENDEEDGGNSLEVIRVKSKKTNKKSKKKINTITLQRDNVDKGSRSLLTEPNVIVPGWHERLQNREACHNLADTTHDVNDVITENIDLTNVNKTCTNLSGIGCQVDSKPVSAFIPKFDSGIDTCDLSFSGELSSRIHTTDVSRTEPSEVKCVDMSSKDKMQITVGSQKPVQTQIESKIAEICSADTSGSSSKNADLGNSVLLINTEHSSNHISSEHLNNKNVSSVGCSGANDFNRTVNADKTCNYSKTFNHDCEIVFTEKENHQDYIESGHETSDKHLDVYTSNKEEETSEKSYQHSALSGSSMSRVQSDAKLKDYMDYILQVPDSPPLENKDRPRCDGQITDLSLRLDNNTTLQLMLDVFTHEDEKLLKMFATRENHTEGDSSIVFVVISDQCLYLLHYRRSLKKFLLQASAMLQDLLFISTGINDQTLNIESRGKNNQKQRLWLTPGHQALTLAILSCLTSAVKAISQQAMPAKSNFSVESEVPLQNIALRKYIARELVCEAQEVTVSDYSLVFWEDPSSASSLSLETDTAYKEGTLLLRSQDPLKPHVWKPVYVVLKNSMLCISNKKSDPRPYICLGLGGDQCVGCRATSTADREHCVELIVAEGGSWFLAAASGAEISEWRQALCLAVSQGTVENNMLSSCIPCCAVLSCNHLFLCHEDLHTKFYRTLGRAVLEDITAFAVDTADPTYCIIEFESQETGVSSNQWTLFFSSSEDLDRFKKAVSSAWRQIYQIELPISAVGSLSLQHHCHSCSQQLKEQLTLK